MAHVLIVEDDVDSAASLRALIASERFSVSLAHSLRDARKHMAMRSPDIVLLDLQLPDGSGMDLYADPQLMANSEVVLITGHASLDTSIQALRLGAADYLVKPINMRQLNGVLSRFMKPATLRAEVKDLTANLAQTGHFGHLWGRTPVMQRVYEQISRVAATSVTVFITGESGTGKEVVAQTVHDLSRRRKQPFLAVNCGAISPNLIESEIFGHEKGSFTGADRQHLGFFERASGGTLFLDEITEMPPELQVKLLRVLETGHFMRVGSTQQQDADVRIIAATNRVPREAVAVGKLREDLFYRLNVFPIALPPLRDRLQDVELLATHFLAGIGAQEGSAKRFTRDAIDALGCYDWPGNVRELRNAVHRGYVMATGPEVDAQWLPLESQSASAPRKSATGASNGGASAVGSGSGALNGAGPTPNEGSGLRRSLPDATPVADAAVDGAVAAAAQAQGPTVTLPIGSSLAHAERALILATLRHFHHQKERTAAALGISLKTLYNRLKEYAEEGETQASDGG